MSKGLRKAAIAALIIVAIAYLGARLYVRSEAGAALREAEYALRDVVKLDYAGYSAGLGGSLSLEELTIRPANAKGEVFVKRLTLAAENLPGLLSARRHISAGRLPDTLSLTFTDLRLNFDSPLYQRLNTWSAGLLIGTPLDHLACGDAEGLDAQALNDMGYPYLAANIHAKLTRGRDQQAALLSLDINAEDIAHVRGEAVLRSDGDALLIGDLTRGSAALVDADLRYRDDGYFDARNYYCAAQRDSDVAAFLQAHRQAVGDYLHRLGAVPSDELMSAYLRLTGSPGSEAHIAVKPREALPIRALTGMDGKTLTETLAPEVAVNGEAVETVAVRWVRAQRGEAASGEDDSESRKARYYAADPAALNQLVGSYARLQTYDGNAYEGEITEASGSRVTLQRRFQGGDMSFGVAMGNIKAAEIYRRSPLPADMQPKPEEDAAGAGDTETVVVQPETEPPGSGEDAEGAAPEDTQDAGSESEPDV